MTEWRSRLRGSPELLPLTLDPATDRLGFVAMTPVDYEKASFLDGRLDRPIALERPVRELVGELDGLPVATDFIFHVGHVGSTLMSRLLGSHPAVFGVREPQPLRTLAQAELDGAPWDAAALDARLTVLLQLCSRTWGAPKRSLVKATSVVGEIAGRMMIAAPDSRAVLMTTAPETYLATILGGPNSRVELRAQAPARLARLHRRLGGARWDAARMSDGELAAMSWAAEMAALHAVADQVGGRALWLDFDRFLAEPRQGISQVLEHLHGAADRQEVEQIARSPYFARYSKAPEYGYGPEVRQKILEDAAREHDAEMRRGLAWLNETPALRRPTRPEAAPYADMHTRAEAGDPEALAFTAVLAALGAGEPQDWRMAVSRLARAVDRGSTFARSQLCVLADRALDVEADGATLAGAVDLQAWMTPPVRRRLSDDPRIAAVDGFLPARCCDWLIERARGRLRRAQVFDAVTGRPRVDAERSNTAFTFEMGDLDVVTVAVRARIAAAISVPTGALEPIQVLHYDPGESFAAHFDFLDTAVEGYAVDVTRRGQRIATFLVYLNDGYTAGETDFPMLRLSHKGRTGDALIFSNVDAAGQPHRRTLHAGLAPQAGEKWLLSQWVRDRGSL